MHSGNVNHSKYGEDQEAGFGLSANGSGRVDLSSEISNPMSTIATAGAAAAASAMGARTHDGMSPLRTEEPQDDDRVAGDMSGIELQDASRFSTVPLDDDDTQLPQGKTGFATI
jgi:hypothetical protein